MKKPIRHAKILDIMTQFKKSEAVPTEPYGYTSVVREEILELEYRPGDAIRDSITGEEGTVLAGTRKAVTTV